MMFLKPSRICLIIALLLALSACGVLHASAAGLTSAAAAGTEGGTNFTVIINNSFNGNANRNIHMEHPDDITGFIGVVSVQGYIRESVIIRDRPGVLIPVPGALIYFINNGTIVAQTVSNPIGFYSVTVPADFYTIVVATKGFQTEIIPISIPNSLTFDIGLVPVPFNGFVPYLRFPVLETSPGREVECFVYVENYQITDQMVTFTAVTPPEWQAWFPLGEAMMIRSGSVDQLIFKLKYTGKQQGPHIMKIVVNGGAYFAEIPVVVIVKDLPYEKVELYAFSPEKIVKPGTTATFYLSTENKYAQDKAMNFVFDKPPNWSVSTGNGTAFLIPDGYRVSTGLYVYVPSDTKPGDYYVNVSLEGEGVTTDTVRLHVQVEGTPLFDVSIKSTAMDGGYPLFNGTSPGSLSVPLRIYNSWDFPLSISIAAEVGDNWPFYISGAPTKCIILKPGEARELTIKATVPNGTYGNYTANVYVSVDGQESTQVALIRIPAPPEKPSQNGWEGLVLTAATAGAILTTLMWPAKKRKIR